MLDYVFDKMTHDMWLIFPHVKISLQIAYKRVTNGGGGDGFHPF